MSSLQEAEPRALGSPAAPAAPPATGFTLGVEEELLFVDPGRMRLCDPPLQGVQYEGRDGKVVEELSRSMVELVTPILTRADEAREVLGRLRDRVVRQGATLLGSGLHPDGAFGDVRHNCAPRYREISETMGGMMGRTPACGVHVHVGMPDPETTIRACNGMRKWVPLLQGLAANSPFWHGCDSRLSSARVALLRSMPRSGLPRAFRDWEDYRTTVEEICDAGAFADDTYIWWDLRPHPRLGTLEVRAPDAQSSLRDLTAIVALTHCLAVHEATTEAPGDDPSPEALDETSFRALRDGRLATLRFEGALRPLAEVAELALERCAAPARELGCADELDEVRRLLAEGNGADRQRAAHAVGGVDGLLATLCSETHPRGRRFDGPLAVPLAQAA